MGNVKSLIQSHNKSVLIKANNPLSSNNFSFITKHINNYANALNVNNNV